MGNINYNQWITGNDCCKNNCDGDCNCHKDVCDCENILLEISKLHTDDEILQDEIDELSGKVEVISATVDTKLDASAYTPVDLTDYATKQWVEDKGYITTVEPLKTINGESLIGEGNIVISGDCDLSDYYTKEEVDELIPSLSDYATEQWVLNQNYVTNSELIQYITNLQEQINSLVSAISGCCGETGETLYRWVTMTGDNDYWCSGTTKYSKEKEQSSTDGINWTDTGNIRSGSTILEENSAECGYVTPYKVSGVYQIVGNVYSGKVDCDSSTTITKDEIKNAFRSASFITSINFGNCIDTIDEQALLKSSNLVGNVDIPSNIKTIGKQAFASSNASAYTLHEGLETIGIGAFSYNDIQSIAIPNSVTEISYMAFSYCPALSSVTIGSGVTHIGHGAFETAQLENVKITSMVINATTPPTLDSNENSTTFYGSYPISVPAASVDAYKAAWPRYASRIQSIQ